MAFEYKVLVLPAANYDVDEEVINLHGERGWELVSVVIDKASYRICYFKRRVPRAEPDAEETVGMQAIGSGG